MTVLISINYFINSSVNSNTNLGLLNKRAKLVQNLLELFPKQITTLPNIGFVLKNNNDMIFHSRPFPGKINDRIF